MEIQDLRQTVLFRGIDEKEIEDALTALSKELGKMQRDGIISVNRNHFCIL